MYKRECKRGGKCKGMIEIKNKLKQDNNRIDFMKFEIFFNFIYTQTILILCGNLNQ